MKRMPSIHSISQSFFAFTFVSLLGLSQSLLAEDEVKHPAKPLLWEISGNGMEKPSYLFGTIHLSDPRLTTLHPSAQKAFDSANAVFTEIPLDDKSQISLAPLMMRKDGKTLNESIDEKLSESLNSELKRINPALDSSVFQSLATWAVGITLPLLPDQLSGRPGLDKVLWDKAVANGKKTGAIEKPMEQLAFFLGLKEEEQVIFLSEIIRMLQDDRSMGRDSIALLKEAYLSGDVAEVESEMQHSLKEMEKSEHNELGQRMMKSLLNVRNETMAESIASVMKNEPGQIHFFCAGAAHFCMDESIQSHLKKAGYKITRIDK